MTKSFEFETADGVRLEVDVHVECRDRDGADFNYDIIWIGRPGEAGPLRPGDPDYPGDEVKFDSLDDGDKVRLNAMAEETANDSACDAAQEYAEGEADRLFDNWKDRDL